MVKIKRRTAERKLRADTDTDVDSDDKVRKLEALGATAFKNKQYMKALEYYDKALKLRPYNEIIWNNKGVVLRTLGKLEDAIGCYDRALELNAECRDAWCNRGFALEHLGKLKAAIESYDKALEIDPKLEVALNSKSECLRKLKAMEGESKMTGAEKGERTEKRVKPKGMAAKRVPVIEGKAVVPKVKVRTPGVRPEAIPVYIKTPIVVKSPVKGAEKGAEVRSEDEIRDRLEEEYQYKLEQLRYELDAEYKKKEDAWHKKLDDERRRIENEYQKLLEEKEATLKREYEIKLATLTDEKKVLETQLREKTAVEDEMAKLLLKLDTLLEQLPEDVISAFVKTDDFKLYEKVLSRYKSA
jgi:tetratricopeptide (TPR) repeat protein